MTITKEGALASFYTVNKAPIKHLRVYFSPKQAGDGDPSPENVREIEGINYITIFSKGTSIVDFTKGGTVRWYVPKNYLKKDVMYWGFIDNTLGTTTVKLSLRLRDANNVSLGTYYSAQTIAPGECKNIWAIFKITTQTDSIQFSVSNATSNTIIKERGLWFYKPEDHVTIDFDSYIYSGYIDLITGELVEEWISINVPDTTDKILGSTGSFINNSMYQGDTFTHRYFVISQQSTTNVDLFSDKLTKGNCYGSAWKWSYEGTGLLHFSVDNDVIGVTSETSAADRNVAVATWLQANPIQMVYKLKTPIVHQLTPTQLSTLIGKNNFWSNADRVEIEYDLAESNDELYRRRNIILNTPHIETAAGSIASFKTDMQAPLKECKMHFAPVQAGSGTPSPDNVREITGWNGIELYNNNDIIFVPSANNYSSINSTTIENISNGIRITATTGAMYANVNWNIDVSQYVGQTIRFIHKASSERTGAVRCYITTVVDGKRIQIVQSSSSNWNSTYTIPEGAGTLSYSLYVSDNVKYGAGLFTDYILPRVVLADSPDISTPIDWTSDIGTIYGGYIDLIKGELVETYRKYNLGDLSVVTYGAESYDGDSGTNAMYYITNTGTGIGYGGKTPYGDKIVCAGKNISGYWIGTWSNPDDHIWEFCINANNQLHVVFDNATVGITTEMTFTQRRNKITEWLQSNPITVVVPRQTPVVYSLTPTKLTALRGTNNIWANTNGPVEIKYWTH